MSCWYTQVDWVWLCFSAGSALDAAFPSQAHGMTNRGRGPAVPPAGVCQCLDSEQSWEWPRWGKSDDFPTVLFIQRCLCLFNSSGVKDERASDDSFQKGKALWMNYIHFSLLNQLKLLHMVHWESSITKYLNYWFRIPTLCECFCLYEEVPLLKLAEHLITFGSVKSFSSGMEKRCITKRIFTFFTKTHFLYVFSRIRILIKMCTKK